MKTQNVLRTALAAVVLAATLFIGAPNAKAQGGMPPEIAAKIKAWQKWAEQHKKLTLLGDQLFQVQKMDADAAYALNKTQAAKILTVIRPWRTRTTMTEDDATSVYKAIGNVLTMKQIKRMTQIEPPSVTMRKRGLGGGAGKGGPPAGGAMPKFPDPPKGGWNPFNADTMPFVQARPAIKKNNDQFFASLERRAKG